MSEKYDNDESYEDDDAVSEEQVQEDNISEDDIPEDLKQVASTRGKYYLTNQDLLPAVIEAKDLGYVTDKLARMLMLLANMYSKKSNFINYSFREDMVSEALVNLCKNALKFDPEQSSNPFAYYTTAINRSFLQYMTEEKKHHYVRDKMLINNGKDPSHNFENNPFTRKMKAKDKKKDEKKKEQNKKKSQKELQEEQNNKLLDF